MSSGPEREGTVASSVSQASCLLTCAGESERGWALELRGGGNGDREGMGIERRWGERGDGDRERMGREGGTSQDPRCH